MDEKRHVIGIYDKGRKKIKFIESSHIFAMEQQIINFEEKVDNKASLLSNYAAKASLVETFGSLKSRNMLNKSIRNRITHDNVSDASLIRLADTIQDNAANTLVTNEGKFLSSSFFFSFSILFEIFNSYFFNYFLILRPILFFYWN